MNQYIKFDDLLRKYPKYDEKKVDRVLSQDLKNFNKKIIVLDDDPTGVQTVHGVYVYTDWEQDSILNAFDEPQSMFFILTNSRSFSKEETTDAHKSIAKRIAFASKLKNKDFLVISRSDSTLRGHYPLETETVRREFERHKIKMDGEIILPMFAEGGRFTAENIHYVKHKDELIPSGETEFAQDKTFGYKASDLREWISEKCGGKILPDEVMSIGIDELRSLNFDAIADKLCKVKDFGKVIVNAIDYVDVKIFTIAVIHAINRGKRFIFRTAAAFPKIMGGIGFEPLLSREKILQKNNKNGGLVVIGSHVNKTTRQFNCLKALERAEFIEIDTHRIINQANGFEAEVRKTIEETERAIIKGKTAVVYTRRDRIDAESGLAEDNLKIAVKISETVTEIVGRLSVKPSFIIAKGGITSSDIGTKSLKVKKALVAGQIRPGIPVWITDSQSKFPGMAYIIFPGNVGEDETLYEITSELTAK